MLVEAGTLVVHKLELLSFCELGWVSVPKNLLVLIRTLFAVLAVEPVAWQARGFSREQRAIEEFVVRRKQALGFADGVPPICSVVHTIEDLPHHRPSHDAFVFAACFISFMTRGRA